MWRNFICAGKQKFLFYAFPIYEYKTNMKNSIYLYHYTQFFSFTKILSLSFYIDTQWVFVCVCIEFVSSVIAFNVCASIHINLCKHAYIADVLQKYKVRDCYGNSTRFQYVYTVFVYNCTCLCMNTSYICVLYSYQILIFSGW